MQEQEDDKDDQRDGDQKSFDDLLHAFCNCFCLVKRYGVIHVLREVLLHLRHQLLDACGRFDRIGAGQLVNGEYRGGLTIQAAFKVVSLRAQFDPGDVFHSDDSAIWSFTNDDVSKLFRGRQPPLSEKGVRKLLVCRSGLAAHLTSRIHRVLRLDGVGDVRDRDAQFGQLVRLYPQPHGILPRAENLRLADTVQPCDGIIEVDVRIVGQERRIVSAVRRGYGDQHKRRGRRFFEGDPIGVNFGRKLTGGQLLA